MATDDCFEKTYVMTSLSESKDLKDFNENHDNNDDEWIDVEEKTIWKVTKTKRLKKRRKTVMYQNEMVDCIPLFRIYLKKRKISKLSPNTSPIDRKAKIAQLHKELLGILCRNNYSDGI